MCSVTPDNNESGLFQELRSVARDPRIKRLGRVVFSAGIYRSGGFGWDFVLVLDEKESRKPRASDTVFGVMKDHVSPDHLRDISQIVLLAPEDRASSEIVGSASSFSGLDSEALAPVNPHVIRVVDVDRGYLISINPEWSRAGRFIRHDA